MKAIDKKKALQAVLEQVQDGILGPRDRGAFDSLAAAPDDAEWPAPSPSAPTVEQGGASGARSANFSAFMPFIFEWEGTAFENDPDDSGNKGDGSEGNYGTKFGIDAASHPGVNIRDLTMDQALSIYWGEWVRNGCVHMASPMAEVFFNCAVNMGLSKAVKFGLGITDWRVFLDRQESNYRTIAAVNPVDRKYLAGWLNRTEALRKRFVV